MPFAPQCGYPTESGANFCASCGYRLQPAQESEETSSADEPTTELELDADLIRHPAVLVVTQGPAAGSRFELSEARVTVGRHPESDIFLDDITVSRRHAEVYRDGLVQHVKDMGSLNGTYLNSPPGGGCRVEERRRASSRPLQARLLRRDEPMTAQYRSIGQVLDLLKDEFSDISISKIRFLESQGLIDPERNQSGYRKFTETDVNRLRWVSGAAAGSFPSPEGHQGAHRLRGLRRDRRQQRAQREGSRLALPRQGAAQPAGLRGSLGVAVPR